MDCNDANVLMMRVARTWPGTAFHLSSDLKMSTGRVGNNLNNNDHQQMARTMNNEHALPPTEPLTERDPITTASAKQKLASLYLRSLVASPAQMYFDALLIFGEICCEIGSGSECQFPGDCSASIITDSPSLMDHSSPY